VNRPLGPCRRTLATPGSWRRRSTRWCWSAIHGEFRSCGGRERESLRRTPHSELHPTSRALGAAVQADILVDRPPPDSLARRHALSRSASIRWWRDVEDSSMLNSTIPATGSEMFTTGVDNRRPSIIHAGAGASAKLVADTRSWPVQAARHPAMPACMPRVQMPFQNHDANGIRSVTATELRTHTTDRRSEAVLRPDRRQVEKMLLDSFEPRRRRISPLGFSSKARNEAETVILATARRCATPEFRRDSARSDFASGEQRRNRPTSPALNHC